MIPAWAADAALALAGAVYRLLSSQSDEERLSALQDAAEATKAALDRARFGG